MNQGHPRKSDTARAFSRRFPLPDGLAQRAPRGLKAALVPAAASGQGGGEARIWAGVGQGDAAGHTRPCPVLIHADVEEAVLLLCLAPAKGRPADQGMLLSFV